MAISATTSVANRLAALRGDDRDRRHRCRPAHRCGARRLRVRARPRGARLLRHMRGVRRGTHRPLSTPPVAICAPNAFKGTLSALAAAKALALGVRDAGAGAIVMPVADGGDGTLDVLLAAR